MLFSQLKDAITGKDPLRDDPRWKAYTHVTSRLVNLDANAKAKGIVSYQKIGDHKGDPGLVNLKKRIAGYTRGLMHTFPDMSWEVMTGLLSVAIPMGWRESQCGILTIEYENSSRLTKYGQYWLKDSTGRAFALERRKWTTGKQPGDTIDQTTGKMKPTRWNYNRCPSKYSVHQPSGPGNKNWDEVDADVDRYCGRMWNHITWKDAYILADKEISLLGDISSYVEGVMAFHGYDRPFDPAKPLSTLDRWGLDLLSKDPVFIFLASLGHYHFISDYPSTITRDNSVKFPFDRMCKFHGWGAQTKAIVAETAKLLTK